MKTLEITAYIRENFGKKATKELRERGMLPCTLNKGKETIQLYIDMVEAHALIYTPEVYFVRLKTQTASYSCIITQQEFHPVNDMPYHMKFVHIFEDKKILMRIPIRPIGNSPGVAKGGNLLKKLRRLRVYALPKHMPAHIDVDISGLDLAQTAKVRDLEEKEYVIEEDSGLPVVTITIPRSLRSKASDSKDK